MLIPFFVVCGVICFCVFWFAVTQIETGKRNLRRDTDEMRAELVSEMLRCDKSVEEIERILLAWNGNKRAVARLVKSHREMQAAKPQKKAPL